MKIRFSLDINCGRDGNTGASDDNEDEKQAPRQWLADAALEFFYIRLMCTLNDGWKSKRSRPNPREEAPYIYIYIAAGINRRACDTGIIGDVKVRLRRFRLSDPTRSI